MSLSLKSFLEIRGLPIVDVRSEAEFKAGHIPQAVNIPLLNDAERKIVGTAYKQNGQHEAIREGIRLVGPRLTQIINDTERISNCKEILVHCWRGGMRSRNFCQFVGMAGIKSQSLDGGYKGYRQAAVESFKGKFPFLLITGFTGSGKSEILRALKEKGEQILDLERLANHKGSVFGGLMMPDQPTTEQFQNELFEEILKLDLSRRVWLEDESLAIGKIFLPVDFWNTMKTGDLIEINVPKSIRIERLVSEYGDADRSEFLEIMGKIIKRLGGQHYNSAREKLLQDDMHSVIDILLTYYDKAYRESIEKRKNQIIKTVDWDGKGADGVISELLAY